MAPGGADAARLDSGADYVALGEDPFSAHRRLLALAGRPRRVLDIGGSGGNVSEQLARQGASVVVLDIDPAAVELARARGLEALVVDVTQDLPPLAGTPFDLVLCADVLEHLPDPGRVLRRLNPLVADEGRLVCSVPNGANWALRLSLLAGRWDYTDRGLLDRTHLRNFTRRTFLATLRDAGYRLVEFDVTCPVPVLRGGAVSRLAHGAGRLLPGLLAYQFLAAAVPVRP